MNTLQLSDEELRMVRTAVQLYLSDLGHEESDLMHEAKLLVAKLEAVTPQREPLAGQPR